MDRDATRLIRRLAERQHGVVARWQLTAEGVGAGVVRNRCEAGVLIRLFPGVFALGHSRLSRRGWWMAAVLACGPGAVLSHASAADLWGLRGSRGPIEVLRRSGGGRHAGIRIHQTRRLDPTEVTLEAGIPITSIERTLLDVAGRRDSKQLERMLVAADRSGRLSWGRLARLLERERGRGRKGVGRLRQVALEVDPRATETRSVSEIDFLALWRELDMPMPEVNVLVVGHLVDFLWPEQRVAVEADSYEYHGDRPAFEHDHEVEVDLIAAGYDVHRATYRMLERDPDRFLANVARALRQRTASNPCSVGAKI